MEVAEEFDEAEERIIDRSGLNASGVSGSLMKTPVRGVYKKVRLGFIHLFLHKLTLFWADNSEIVMEISYGKTVKDSIKVSVDTMLFLNHYEQFSYIENHNSISIKLFEIIREKSSIPTLERKGSSSAFAEDKKELRLIKTCTILINNLTSDALLKGIFQLEDPPGNDNMNYVTSELEVSLVVSNENKKTNHMFVDFQEKQQSKSNPRTASVEFMRNFYKVDFIIGVISVNLN